MTTATRFAVALVSAAVFVPAASAQLLNDGNMDSLPIGNAPDNAVGAGAWAFPANYQTNLIAEPVARPDIYTIAASPSGPGNSLRLFNPTGTANDNFHLPNIFTAPVLAAPGVILRVAFNFWVDPAGGGGGSIYVGGDNGGGGFSNATGDRTAQLTWLANGSLNYANNLGVNTPITNYNPGVWQNVVIEIDTDARNYDLFYSEGANPVVQVGNNLPFRAPNPALSVIYDRISYVQFGGTVPIVSSYLDNVVVEAIPAPGAAGLLALAGLAAARRRR